MFDFSAIEAAEAAQHIERCLRFPKLISLGDSAGELAADRTEDWWWKDVETYGLGADLDEKVSISLRGGAGNKSRRKCSNIRHVPALREMREVADLEDEWCPGFIKKNYRAQARQDRLKNRQQRIAAYVNPKHATRMHGAARRRALSPVCQRRAAYSDAEIAIFDQDIDYYYDDEYDNDDNITNYGDDGNMNDLKACESQIQAKLQQDSTLECFGLCSICMEPRVLLELNCSHAFCLRCLLGQLAARWNGAQISFTYLQCGVCRQQLGHRQLQVPMCANLAFKEQVERLAANKFVEQNRHMVPGSLPLTSEEIRARAISTIATYTCGTCCEPFCGGLKRCAQQIGLSADGVNCSQCEWASHSGHANDQRCMLHGHRSAILKCDFCCSVAIYRCFGNTNFCERCHNQAGSKIYYPCPGPLHCTLEVPHPCIRNDQGEGSVRSFVLGCSACQGCDDHNQGFSLGFAGEFGHPERKWQNFTGGDMLIASIGEREMRDRLRLQHPHALQSGSAAECAERLLLLELGMKTIEDIFATAGGQRDVLARRLEAVGLSQDVSSAELAGRLLLLLNAEIADFSPLVGQDDEDSDDDLPPLISLEQ